MIAYKKIKNMRFFLIYAAIMIEVMSVHAQDTALENFDIMVDFAYPVSAMQGVRHDLSQAVYFLQRHDFDTVISLLHGACAQPNLRKAMSDDDRDYIEQMIQQIDSLINQLEQTGKSAMIADLCQQMQDHL